MSTSNDKTYSEAIEQVMLHNNYFAPLKLIYKEIWKYKNQVNVRGKTPNFTIQERVQRDKRFTRIGLGVYGLTAYLDKLNKVVSTPRTVEERKKRVHAEIQGMLLEIGSSRPDVEDTYTNDKKWKFQNKTLGSLATLQTVPAFTYPNIVRDTVRFFDVIWFNRRGFPDKIFEVEETTDFRDAFLKFAELQDFEVSFCCISDDNRRAKFEKEVRKNAFEAICDRCEFFSYDQVRSDYQLSLKRSYL